MLQVVAGILRRRQSDGWLVGGSVRDLELGRRSPDLDIVVSDDPRAVAREIASVLRVPWFALSERHPAYRVMGLDGRIDVAAVKGCGILEDLADRDFTVNAMAVPIDAEGLTDVSGGINATILVDPFDGLRDLREKRLVAVSDHVFVQDPLRMLRAVRFWHVLGLELGDSLGDSIRAHAPLLAATAAERVTAEIALTIAEGRTTHAAKGWEQLGLLGVMLPEVMPPERLSRALALLERLDDMLGRPGAWFPGVGDQLAERLARPVDGALSLPVALRLAGLIHALPALEAAQVGRRLKLSGDMASLLETVSRYFAEAAAPRLPARPVSGPPGREAVLFMWQTTPWEAEIILLAAAATQSAPGARAAVDQATLGSARQLFKLWAERASGRLPRMPVDGDLLMRELGLPGGPRLGRVMREVSLAWEAGEIKSAEEALAAARISLDRGA
jgi:poly(A) polymerase